MKWTDTNNGPVWYPRLMALRAALERRNNYKESISLRNAILRCADENQVLAVLQQYQAYWKISEQEILGCITT